MNFTFSSCIEIAKGELDGGDGNEFGLCESEIILHGEEKLGDSWLLGLDLDQLNKLEITVLKVSDGSDIWETKGITIELQQVFTSVLIPFKTEVKSMASKHWFEEFGMEEAEFYQLCIWYELIKLLSGGRIRCSECENVIDFTKFICHSSEKYSTKQLNFVMELRSGTIVRKLSQFTLEMVQTGEIDLFLLSSRMFESQLKSNDIVYDFMQKTKKQTDQIDTFVAEKKALDIILKDRDAKTKDIMVNLLNEKKKKIVELETRLNDFEHKVSDSEIINKHITEAVSELNSPGKRKRKFGTEFKSPTSSTRKRRSIMGDFHSSNLIPKEVEKEIDDNFNDFDDNRYMGINRRLNLNKFDPRTSQDMEENTPAFKREEEELKKEEIDKALLEVVKKGESNKSFDDFIDKDENDRNSALETTNQIEDVLKEDKINEDESSTEEETDAGSTADTDAENDTEYSV